MDFWVWGFGKCFGQKSYENGNGGVGGVLGNWFGIEGLRWGRRLTKKPDFYVK